MCGGASPAISPSSSRSGAPAHGRCHTSSCRAEHCQSSRSLSHLTASSSSSAFSRNSRSSSSTTTTSLSDLSPTSRTSFATRRKTVIVRALFEPPPFQPSKLSVTLSPGTTCVSPAPPDSRRYTLTHNDLTGQLWLTVGADFNSSQISGFYTRLLRDEVIAEWTSEGGVPSLHLFCHVSGEEKWLAPPVLRNYIFRREMPLVLDCLLYAEKELFKLHPRLAQAPVFVHFQSALRELDRTECWGVLGERETWQAVPTSILQRLLYRIVGLPLETLQPARFKDGQDGACLPAAFNLSPVVAAATIDAAVGETREAHELMQQPLTSEEVCEDDQVPPCTTPSSCAHPITSQDQGSSVPHSQNGNAGDASQAQAAGRLAAALHTTGYMEESRVAADSACGPVAEALDGSLLFSTSRQMPQLMAPCRK